MWTINSTLSARSTNSASSTSASDSATTTAVGTTSESTTSSTSASDSATTTVVGSTSESTAIQVTIISANAVIPSRLGLPHTYDGPVQYTYDGPDIPSVYDQDTQTVWYADSVSPNNLLLAFDQVYTILSFSFTIYGDVTHDPTDIDVFTNSLKRIDFVDSFEVSNPCGDPPCYTTLPSFEFSNPPTTKQLILKFYTPYDPVIVPEVAFTGIPIM
ncbi:unnamed protein product [Didymodactylos carnosus]|uniref:Uncharacterized protein n=1 Tax=Didymodactylos carnosus TaxID=1234261 RepID=A0A8S2HMR3_9BILA|nr:unnamed protein product [Didymodactylos carnosus]CAF3659971.1 unnamed protein product [Didymodactylos carnosus]